MIKLTPIVSRWKTKQYKHIKSKKLALNKKQTADLSSFDKQWSDAHFVSFILLQR